MKVIPLTQGQVALVDDSDYDWLMQWSWCAVKARNGGRGWYAKRGEMKAGRVQKTIPMHRAIMDAPVGITVDHRDGNGLNNQRYNLRLATRGQQVRNRGVPSNNTSGFKGVHWASSRGKWRAQIQANGKMMNLGDYDTSDEARRVYEEAVIKYHGEFANLGWES
jgi:hypothetical protein